MQFHKQVFFFLQFYFFLFSLPKMPLQPDVTSLRQKSSALTTKKSATNAYNHFILGFISREKKKIEKFTENLEKEEIFFHTKTQRDKKKRLNIDIAFFVLTENQISPQLILFWEKKKSILTQNSHSKHLKNYL